MVRWAAFSCVLVPVVLVWYGASLAGAAGTALGLAAVTGICRLLLRQSERGSVPLLEEEPLPHRGRHGRSGPRSPRGGHARGARPGRSGASGRAGSGARRSGRRNGGHSPVD
ncbi:hypothetical protein ACFV6E_34415 [Streptomyces sp. NPDC059785]|uniref:hypothetical protein n=1 Tax=unclassified Streptomyces TaxID=2593676 RepID=UPI0036657B96